MKNLKKILVVLCVVAALSVGAVLASFAAEVHYSGTMDKLTPLIDDVPVQAANGTDMTYNALKRVINYLTKTPVNPNSPGYQEKMATLDPYIAATINAYSDMAVAASDTQEKKSHLNKIVNLVEGFGVEDQTLVSSYHAAAISTADAFLNVGLAPETTAFADVKSAYDTAMGIIRDTPLDNAELNAKVAELAEKMLVTYLNSIDTASGILAKDKAIDEALAFLADAGIDNETNIAKITAKVPKALFDSCGAISSLDSSAAKSTELSDISNFITKHSLTDEASVSAFESAAFVVAEGFLGDIEDTKVESTARNAIRVNLLQSFVDKGYLDPETNEEYAALLQDFEGRKALQAAAKEANRQAMLAQSTLPDYDMSTLIDTDFSSGRNPFASSPGSVQNKGTNFAGLSNGTFTITYGGSQTNGNTYAEYRFPDNTGLKGLVVDFDFCTFSALPYGGFALEGGGIAPIGKIPDGYNVMSGGNIVVYPTYFWIDVDGTVYANDGNETVLLEDSIVPGQWMHYTCIFNNDDFSYSLYCEYEFLGTYPANYFRDGSYTEMTYDLIRARFNGSTTGSGEFSLDNLQVYQGTTLRDIGLLERLAGEERFTYFANYYLDENRDVMGRKLAYNEVSRLLPEYWEWTNAEKTEGNYLTENAEIRALIDDINIFDYDGFSKKLRAHNLSEFSAKVDDFSEMLRNLDVVNISDRIKVANSIDEFITKTGNDIDRNDQYDATNKLFLRLRTEAYTDSNSLEFIKWVKRCHNMTTLSAKQKYYDKATACLYMEGFPIDVSDEHLNKEGFEELKAAYEIYVGALAEIEVTQRNDNSKKIIACVDIISGYSRDEWDANYEYISRFVSIIRTIVKENNYNAAYEGLVDAIEVYNEYNDYFYSVLQQRHIDELTTRLEYVANNDAYIEKSGTLAYIGRYLEANKDNIDPDNAIINDLVRKYETALAEVEFRKEDYDKILVQNAHYFVALVEKMRITESYGEKKALYDQATPLYFALDGSVEGAMNAVDVFDQHTQLLESIERSSERFIEAVLLLNTAETKEELFARLVDCYAYSLDAESSFDGVAEAMEIYNEKYEAYCNEVTVANEIITETVVVTGSVRSNCGVTPIIAVIIKKIFE